MNETKSKIRKKIEELEEEIQKSWLKDIDKTKEMKELVELLGMILESESLEAFFHNTEDLDYFLKKFTKEVTLNILRQNFIHGEGGDDVALEVLLQFLRIFLKFYDKPQYSTMFEFIRDIFDPNKPYYKVSFYGNFRILNSKKMISADKFNETLPRKKEKCREYTPGDHLDVLIENKKCQNLGDRRVWVRGIILREEENSYIIKIAEDGVFALVGKQSFDIAPAGSMTKDYEFRTNLKQWDTIDCYDRGRWFPATVLTVKEEIINELPKVTYRIGFRIYPDNLPEWKSFTKFWNDRNFATDQGGRKYVGDAEGMDEWMAFYSKRIQKFNTYITGDSILYNTKALCDDFDNFSIDDFIPFEIEGKKNFIVGRGNNFSYYFAVMLNEFARSGGFEKLSQILIKDRPYAELVHTIFYIMYNSYSYFHKDYVELVSEDIQKSALSYIKELNSSELRNLKKDTLELIVNVLKAYLSTCKSIEERNNIIEEFSITSSIRMLKTSFLDKRIQAVKTLVDVIKTHKYDKNKSQEILKLVEEHHVFNEIYGPNTHIQLINKSKDLLEIMLQEDKLSDGELELIWAATKKGDLEGKLTILKIFKEISHSLRRKHIQIILNNVYSSKASEEDLINEEILLIYELSISSQNKLNSLNENDKVNDEEDVSKCINYFTKCLLISKNCEGNKISALISKIYDITRLYPQFRKIVIKMCVECMEKNQNTILSMKIFSRYLQDPLISFTTLDFDSLDEEIKTLFKDNFFIELFCNNFKNYKKIASDLANKLGPINNQNQKTKENISNMITFDNFSHTQHIKIRLEFVQLLQSLSIFQADTGSFDFIDFLYELLIVQSICDFDKCEFYSYIKKILEKHSDNKLEERIYNLFKEKICKDTKSCQTLSIQAFESYLMIFLNINSKENNLYFFSSPASRDNKMKLKVYINPERLIGFDILWKIVFDSFSNEIMNKGIETLHNLYMNTIVRKDKDKYTTKYNDSFGETYITDKFDEINLSAKQEMDMERQASVDDTEENYSGILLRKCIGIIKNVVEDKDSQSIEEKRNLIIKCLFFLKLMIEESEKKGTARVKSHSGLLKRKVISLKVDSHISKTNDFEIRVYGNTTMWDLKELISKKAEVGIDFINLMVKNKEMQTTEHGLTVIEMGLNDGDEIKLMMNMANSYIPQAELVKYGKVVPELLKIYNSWFDKYSTDNKQTKDDLVRFIKAVTNSRETIDTDDQRVKTLFGTYDRENKGWIDRESFTSFYIECATRPERRRTVWENLHAMGIRNDLKRYDEPLEVFNSDKTILPRFQLSHNVDFFNILFYLQDLDESIALEAFQFLCSITTSPGIYKEILFWGTNQNKPKLFNHKNIYKLIYSLQIIESFIEDVEIESEGVYSFSIEECILDMKDMSPEDIKKLKVEWMLRFVKEGGFEELVSILNEQLESRKKAKNTSSLMENICLELLIKIIRIFFHSSLNKFEYYRIISSKPQSSNFLSGLFEDKLGDIVLNTFDYFSLLENLMDILSQLSNNLNDNISREEVNIIENTFEFLLGIIGYVEDHNKISNEILIKKGNEFRSICNFGIVNDCIEIREKFAHSLIKFCLICDKLGKIDFILFLFCNSLEIFKTLYQDTNNKLSNTQDFNLSNMNKITEEKDSISSEFFDFFSTLFEIYFNLERNKKLTKENMLAIDVDPKQFVLELSENLHLDLKVNVNLIEEEKSKKLTDHMFVGHLKILTKVVTNMPELKEEITVRYNLIHLIMTRVLFKQNSKEMNEKISRMEFINPDKFDDKNNRSTNMKCRNACYNFILAMLLNSIENFDQFFSMNVLEGEKEENDNIISSAAGPAQHQMKIYHSSLYSKKEDHVGLFNLGCICYMNSMMQQFFMVPTLRYGLLQCNDNILPKKNNPKNIDDNVLHQVQRMFTYLDMSQREDYNPYGFCYSFKDFDGNPTNTSVQQDSQEFLNRFFDKLESGVSSTPFKYLVQSIFAGKTCSQLICEEGCGNVTNRFEDFYNLSLEVANMKTINESLEKFIAPERIDEYNCDTCQKKVTITKRNSLAELPNVLIIHLQRIYYNYEYDRNEKINSRLEFPRVLNLKNFCIEELMRKNKAKKSGSDDIENSENVPIYETDEIYFKKNEYYEYDLVGVNVHIGSADHGHYFSYINTIRKGQDDKPSYDANNEEHANSWLKFNDSHISKFNVSRLEEECFGGNSNSDDNSSSINNWHRLMENNQSAYMLVYERRVKSPIKLITPEPLDRSTLLSFKQEERSKIKKQFDNNKLNITGVDSFNNTLTPKKLSDFYFYDNEKNEYFKYIPFFSVERLISRDFYQEVTLDNSQFQKHQNILDEHFVSFFEKVISVLDETISNMENVESSTSQKISITLLHFIFNILSTKDKQRLLKPAIEKFLHIIEIHATCLETSLDYILSNIHLVLKALYNDEVSIVSSHCDLIFDVIKRGYLISPGNFLNAFKTQINDQSNNTNRIQVYTTELIDDPLVEKKEINQTISIKVVKLCDFLVELFPRIPSRNVNKIFPLYQTLKNISKLGIEMIDYFYHKSAISRFITYLIGRESPCFKEFSTSYESWDLGRGIIHNSEHLIELILNLYKNSSNYKGQNSKSTETSENIKIDENYILSKLDLDCIKTQNFLKFCYSNNENLFSELIVNFSTGNEEFTLQSCEEITKSIDDIGYQYDNEFIKLVKAVLPVLNIQDNYQLLRFEIIIGFPVPLIEEPNLRSKWPIFGYNKLNDEASKWLDYRSTFNTRKCCSLLKKLSQQRSKDKLVVEIFLILLNECLTNFPLMKYIRNMPAEEPQYEDFISWGVSSIHYYTSRYETNIYLDKLKKIVEVLNIQLSNILADRNVLPGFKSFGNKYLPYEIKREEFTLLMQGENLYVIKIEYFTSVISFSKDINFKRSASCYSSGLDSINSGMSISNKELNIDDSQNIENDENTVVYDMNERMSNEREFLKKLLISFNANKKVIVQNKYFVENVYSTMIRYVVFNNSNLDGTIYMKLKKPNIDKELNEFVPNYIVSNINSFYYKNILTILKITPSQEWTTINEMEYDVQVDWQQYKQMQNYNYNIVHAAGPSNYSKKRAYDSLD